MNVASTAPTAPSKSAARKLLESGIIFSAISFATGLINLAFQGLINRRFSGHDGEFGLTNNMNSLIGFLGTPLLIATTAITHYIAHFHANDDQLRLRGILLGCRKVLFWFTIGGSLLAMVLVVPLSKFFNFPRYSLVFVGLACVLAGLWGSFATALCQGLAWFKRLAVIGLIGALLRCSFTWFVTEAHPVAEVAIISTVIGLLANLVLLYWRKEIFRHGEVISAWNREFFQFLMVSAACVGGSYFFLQSDQLVSQRYFSPIDIDRYSTANRLAAALPMVVGPLLVVLFTSRSGERSGNAFSAQIKLLGLYAVGLLVGAAGLLIFRDFCVRLIKGAASPETAGMIAHLSVTMIFSGLIQALGMWALASRWLKISLLYGALGLCYWSTLLSVGTTPDRLLHVMPIAAGVALGVLLTVWLIAMKRHAAQSPNG